MKKFLLPLILLMNLTLSACVTIAIRPSIVPRSAIFSGGIKGGSWLVCLPKSSQYECDVYSYKGGLYERGLFDFESQYNSCYPSFILTDYRSRRGFLVPKSVLQVGQGVYINSKNEGENLDSAISRAYSQLHQAQFAQITLHLSGTCNNGYFEATFANGAPKQRGRIWAGKFFQIWPVSN
ncbi:MAG: hypothetical protein AAB680_05915 [Pseudomonadota bacterium]